MEIYKNRTLDHTKPVQVYKNLHKNMWSVRQQGKIVAHTDTILLKDCEYRVGEKGRQRVIESKSKNVHAYITGFVVDEIPDETYVDDDDCHYYRIVTYNPYKLPYFHDSKDKIPVYNSDWASLDVNDEVKVLAIWEKFS
jgi:hypothetical protein